MNRVLFIITGILIASFSPLNSLPAETAQEPSSQGSAVVKNSTVPQNVTNAPADTPAIKSPKLNETSPSPPPEQQKNQTATTVSPSAPASALPAPGSTNQTSSSNATVVAPRDVTDPEVIVFKNAPSTPEEPDSVGSPGIEISKNLTITKNLGTGTVPSPTTTTTVPPPTQAPSYAFFNSPAYGFKSEPELSGRSRDQSPSPTNQPPLEKQAPSRPSSYQQQPERNPTITQPGYQPVPQQQQYYAPTQTATPTNNPTTGYYPSPSNYPPGPEYYPPPPPAYYPAPEYYPMPLNYQPTPLNYQPTPQGYSVPVPVPVPMYYVQPVAYPPQSPPNYQPTPQYYPAPQPAPEYYSPPSNYQQQPQSYPAPTPVTAPAYYSQSESSAPASPQGSSLPQSVPDDDDKPEKNPTPAQQNYQPAPENYSPPPPANYPQPEYSQPQQSYQPAPQYYPPPPPYYPTPEYIPPQQNYQPAPVYYPTPEYTPPQQNYQPAPEYYPPPPPVYYPAPEYSPPQQNYQPTPEYYPPPPPPPAVYYPESITPKSAPQETAEPYAQPEYYQPQPSYQPTPEYYPAPPPPPAYYPPQQSYQPAPQYYSPPPPPYGPPPYSPPTYYEPPPPPPGYYEMPPAPPRVEEAIHYLELNESVVCGIFPAVNADLYQNAFEPKMDARSYSKYGTALVSKNDVMPFGEAPWRVHITDDKNNLLCQGTIVHNRQILTLASCVNGEYPLEKLRVRYGDWDLLNNVNEYEAYKNYESRICRILPVTCSSYEYGYSSSAGELVLLQVDLVEDYDKYPHTKPACLPKWPYNPPAPYSAPAPYPARAPYSAPPPYFAAPAPSYSVPYGVPPNNPRSYRSVYSEPMYSECWVAGWWATPITELRNHEPPKGSSNAPLDYNPYSRSYSSEKSLIPRRAKVKPVPSLSQSYSYGQCQDEEQQWVGVEGYDACVADKGASIVCLVDDHKPCKSSQTYSSPYSEDRTHAEDQYYHEIQANAAQAKNGRKRAIVVAVVKAVPPCSVYEDKDPSYGGYREQTSKPILALKVSSEDVNFIVDKFWEGALDNSCPALPSPFPGPAFYPESRAYYIPKPPYGPYSRPPQYHSAPVPVPSYSAPPSYYSGPAAVNSENGIPPGNINSRPLPSSPSYAYSSPAPAYYEPPPRYNNPPPPSPEYYTAPASDSPPFLYRPHRLRRASSFVAKVIP